MHALRGGTRFYFPRELVRVHSPDQQEVGGDVRGQHAKRIDQVFDALAGPVGRRTPDHESVSGDAELLEINGLIRVPLQPVPLVDRDRPLRRHAQERRLHIQEPLPYRLADADDAVDPRVEIPHPGHRIEKTEVADNAPVAHDLDRQALAGPQAVRNGFAVEGVQDMVVAADEFPA